MRKAIVLLLFVLAAAIVIGILALPNGGSGGGDKVRFQLQWFDQAQFAGFYVADKKGFYRDEGLEVSIQPGGYGTRPMDLLQADQADIALAPMDTALRGVGMGNKASIIGTVFDRSLVCFMSRKSDNMKTPLDFRGKIVGVYQGFDTENVLNILLKKNNVAPSEVDIRPAGQIAAFESGDFKVWPSYRINEPFLQEAKGTPVDCLKPEDFGIRYYSDSFVVRDQFLIDHPEQVKAFMRASAKGWAYAIQHPEEVIQLMFESKMNLPPDGASKNHQMRMLSEALNYVDRDRGPLFSIDQTQLAEMMRDLESVGLLTAGARPAVLKKIRSDLLSEEGSK